MQKGKKVFSLLLLLGMVLMSVSGCSGAEEKKGDNERDLADYVQINAGTGRFMEEEIKLPTEIRRIRAFEKVSDGSLEVIGETDETGTCFLLKSTDGGNNWEKTKIEGLGKEYWRQIAIAPDGKAVLLSYNKDGTVNGKLADPDGTTKDFHFSLPATGSNNEENQVIQAAYDIEGNLIVLDMYGSLYEVVSDGTCKKTYDTKGADIQYISMTDPFLFAVHAEGILIFDTKEKKAVEAEPVLSNLVQKNGQLASKNTERGQPLLICTGTDTGGVILAWREGIFHFTRGGSILEQLADGSQTSFGSGDLMLLHLAAVDDENIFLTVNNGDSDQMLHYTYDKSAAAVPEKELSVYSLDDSIFLRQTVKLFQKNNPDIHVNLEIGLSGEDSVTLEDALSVLNTDILAGKGPDVLILDGIPMDSYVEKGILCDLTELIDEIDEEDGIFQGIKESSKKDGKIYAMPTRFLISIVEGDEDTVAAGGTLSALAERAEEMKKENSGDMVVGKGSRTLLRDLYYADSATWQKEDGTLDQSALMEYLTYAKQIYELDSVGKEDDFQDSEYGDGTAGGAKVGTSSSARLLSGECGISLGSLAGIYDLQTMCSTEVKTKADYCLMNGGKVKSYIPYLIAGVLEGGNTETALAFVRELLGSKAGNSASNGIPVNRAAYDAVCEEKLDAQNVKDESGVSFGTADGESFDFEYVNLTKEDEKKFTEIVEGLTKPAMTDRVIQELVLEQGDRYLLGEQSLESAVETILQKVNLYLSE